LRKLARIGVALLLLVVLPLAWYYVAANYDYRALAGTYVIQQNGESCKLRLRPDRTFSEELTRGGSSLTVEGTWRRYGEAHVSFSSSFLKVTGEVTSPRTDGEAHGQFYKTLGLFPYLTLAPIDGGPVLRRKLFR
jgi:hypothetical protein